MGSDGYSWHPIMRSILDHWLWKDKPFSKGQAWIDMILLAHHNPSKRMISGQMVPMTEGQLAWPKYKLADRWGWSRDKVERFVSCLEADEMLRQETSQLTTVITLLNYARLRQVAFNGQGSEQDKDPTKDKATTRQRTSHNTRREKKGEEGKEDQKPAGFAHPWLDLPDFQTAWTGWIEMRISKKDRPTEFAKSLAMKKLLEYSGGEISKAIAIVNQSTERGWKGLFPLSEESNGTHQQTPGKYESSQQRKDRRIREVMARYPGQGRSDPDADHPPLHLGAEGTTGG
jgi:hypothetical protein